MNILELGSLNSHHSATTLDIICWSSLTSGQENHNLWSGAIMEKWIGILLDLPNCLGDRGYLTVEVSR